MSVGDCNAVYPIGVVSTDKNVRGRGLEGDTRLTGDGFNLIGCNTYGEYHGYLKFLISGANKGGRGVVDSTDKTVPRTTITHRRLPHIPQVLRLIITKRGKMKYEAYVALRREVLWEDNSPTAIVAMWHL